MPFARSDRAQRQLIENHPELAGDLFKGKQRRIDSMRLRSRLVDDEQRLASHPKLRVGSYEEAGSSRSQRQQALESQSHSPRLSPLLSGKETAEELPFEMDEDATARRPSSAGSLSSPALLPVNEGGNPAADLAQTPEFARSFKFQLEDSPMASPLGSSLTPAQKACEVESSPYGPPWQQSPQAFKRMGLKDIMDQAAATRVSGLTQPLQQAETSTRSNQKLSQKERKRQLQHQRTQETEPIVPPRTVTDASKSTSPWQNVKKPIVSPATTRKDGDATSASTSKGKSRATTRQASTGAPAIPRTPSSPMVHGSGQRNTEIRSKSVQPVIQSIRHTPTTRTGSSVDARTPMAEILAQQQTEKTAVKEAIAKRSLQEIQQEQEFQEWWDQESRRVQEEEAQASSSTPRRGKGGRGKGRSRGSGRGGAAQSAQVLSSTPTPGREDTGSIRGDGRERIRGKGRGH